MHMEEKLQEQGYNKGKAKMPYQCLLSYTSLITLKTGL